MPVSNGEPHPNFLDLPARPAKPRESGLTHVMDKGMNIRQIEGLFDTLYRLGELGAVRDGRLERVRRSRG